MTQSLLPPAVETITVAELQRAYPASGIDELNADSFVTITTWTENDGSKSDMLTATGTTAEWSQTNANRERLAGNIMHGEDKTYLVIAEAVEGI